MTEKVWNVSLSDFGESTVNPARNLWENLNGDQTESVKTKPPIKLQIGDPTIFGNFLTHPETHKALRASLVEEKFSYEACVGNEVARKAVAEYASHLGSVTSADVILTSGCSAALEMCFLALANPGDNLLIPSPGFSYTIWFSGYGIEPQYYNLDPSSQWNVDLKQMETLINKKTKGIVVNNPGNPCGNVFSKKHILEILKIAERYKLPVIADEVYEFFTFPGADFHAIASLSKNVPVLTCSGVTKRFLLPGMRMGWLIINDRGDKLKEIRRGLLNISGRNFVPNSTVQCALPKILQSVPESFFNDNNGRIGRHAETAFMLLRIIPGLNPIMPKGAFYLMVGIDFDKFPKITSSLNFIHLLAEEQNVHVFPSDYFNLTGFFRIILTAPEEMLVEACERIKEFCAKHFQTASFLTLK